MLSRRQLLASSLLVASRSVHAGAGERSVLDSRELVLEPERERRFGKRCLLLRSARVPESTALPLLVLLHGLGETHDEALGIRAWRDRYGLADAYARLVSPPVARTSPSQRYLSDARLADLNRELEAAPFPDVAIVCPFTPNVYKLPPTPTTLDAYASFLEGTVLPAVRAATPILSGPDHLGLDGVSLGGYVSLEVFLRRPKLFGVVGSLQGAYGVALAESYARRLKEAEARRVHLVTSRLDPFRAAALRLAERLGSAATLTDGEGPHDQRYLREAGTLEMLRYQARALHGEPG